jgi:tryptophan synthase beta chain
VGPEHSFYKESGRAEYLSVTDHQALEGLTLLCETEGIIPALETAHAVYYTAELARTLSPEQIVLVCLSGRGDKDMEIVSRALGDG